MAQFTTLSRHNKSQTEKPYPEFPLTAHSTGRWVKQHKRRMFYLGRIEDWKTAREKYKREWPYILQGLTPPPDDDGEWLTVDDLVNTWLDVKRQAVDSRELRLKTWQQYRATCSRLAELLGRQTRADALSPTDLEKLRAALAKDRGPVALAMDIRVTRMVLKYAYDAGLIDRPVRVAMLKQPSRRVIREYRQRNGQRMLEAAKFGRYLTSPTSR